MNAKFKNKLNKFLKAIKEEPLSDFTGKVECASIYQAIEKNSHELFLDTMIEMQCEWLNNIVGAISLEKKNAWYYLEKYLCMDCLLVNLLKIKSGSTAQRVAAYLIYLLSKGYSSFASINYKLLTEYIKTDPDDIDTPNIINFAIASFDLVNKGKTKNNKGILAELLSSFEILDNNNPLIDTFVEYHINNMGINENDDIEFLNLGFIPIEFMIVNLLRKKKKLPVLTKPFELLSTPFSNVPTAQCIDPLSDKDIIALQSFLKATGLECS